MVIFEILTHAITSVLIGYLSFTNTLAGHIENFLPVPEKIIVTTSHKPSGEQKIEDPSLNTFEKIAISTNILKSSVSNILLEHGEYQKAATIASSWDETPYVPAEGLSLNENIENALVNIYCQYKTNEYIRTTTGTGFFINKKGVILTNAHVAQFLLLEDSKNASGEVSCMIRSGNPATPKYHAKLLYISPTWIYENANLISSEAPRGTGERDYALLYVSAAIDTTPLPAQFPTITVGTDLLPRNITGSPIMTAGYPAEALLRGGADTKLFPIVASTTLGELYTFGSNYADIFSVSESAVGEQGASGGPIVVPETQNVIGLIVTKGDEPTEGERSLRALTLSYIDRTIIEETGFSLIQNMQGDVAYRGSIFKSAMVPFLAGILEEELSAE